MTDAVMHKTLNLYVKQPLFVRWFIRLRHLLSPLEALEGLVPKEGRILDLGCGHGLFTNYLALKAPSRNLLGIDPAPAKMQAAKKTEPMVPNTSYLLGSITDIPENTQFDAITIIDVLYLLPEEEQEKIIKTCYRFLNDTGVLVLKTQDTRPKWRYWWTCFQESIMVGFGITRGNGVHFLPAERTRRMLSEAGFNKTEQRNLPSRLLYTNIVFICRKKENLV